MAFALLASLGQTSEFQDKIMEKEVFSLDMLDEEEFLSEVKLYNQKLLSLMLTPEMANTLLFLALLEDEEAAKVEDEDKRLKYAFVCCELFCLDCDPVRNYLLFSSRERTSASLGERPLLSKLINYLVTRIPSETSPISVLNYCKIMSGLIKRERKEMFAAFKEEAAFLPALAKHTTYHPKVMELVWLLMEDEVVTPLGVPEWLAAHDLGKELLAQLKATTEVSRKVYLQLCENVVGALKHTIEVSADNSPFVVSVNTSECVSQIIHFTFGSPQTTVDNDSKELVLGLGLLKALLDWSCKRYVVTVQPQQQQQQQVEEPDPFDDDDFGDFVGAGTSSTPATKKEEAPKETTAVKVPDTPLVEGVSQHFERIGAFLKQIETPQIGDKEGEKEEMMKTRVGLHRLAMLEFLSSLIKTNNEKVFEGFKQHGILGLVLDTLFNYPWSNITHEEVFKLVTHVLQSECMSLISTLFNEDRLLHRIAATVNAPPQGNLGYIVLITAHINNFAKTTQDTAIKSLIEGNSEWEEFLRTKYATEVLKREASSIWKPSDEMLRSTTVLKAMDMKIEPELDAKLVAKSATKEGKEKATTTTTTTSTTTTTTPPPQSDTTTTTTAPVADGSEFFAPFDDKWA